MTEDFKEEALEPVEDVKPLPLLKVYGEGYITRQNGEVVPFTFQGEG